MTSGLRLVITVIILIQSPGLKCQTGDSLPKFRWGIRTSLLEYLPTINLNTGNINLGAEVYLGKRTSVYVNAGVIRFYGQKSDLFFISSLNTHGTRLQLELKHFVGRRRDAGDFSPYVSVQLIGQSTEIKRQETVEDYRDSIPYPNFIHWRQNTYNVSRRALKANFKTGVQIIKSAGLTIDCSVGLGAQYISSVSPYESGFDGSMDIPWNKRFNSGSGIYPNLICQIKAGWTW